MEVLKLFGKRVGPDADQVFDHKAHPEIASLEAIVCVPGVINGGEGLEIWKTILPDGRTLAMVVDLGLLNSGEISSGLDSIVFQAILDKQN
jgi:hypothetical protein